MAGLCVLHDCPVKDHPSQGAECVPYKSRWERGSKHTGVLNSLEPREGKVLRSLQRRHEGSRKLRLKRSESQGCEEQSWDMNPDPMNSVCFLLYLPLCSHRFSVVCNTITPSAYNHFTV